MLSSDAKPLFELRRIAREPERGAKGCRPALYEIFERLVERDHAVRADSLDHRVYVRRVARGDMVRAGRSVDEEFACGASRTVGLRQEVLRKDAAKDER